MQEIRFEPVGRTAGRGPHRPLAAAPRLPTVLERTPSGPGTRRAPGPKAPDASLWRRYLAARPVPGPAAAPAGPHLALVHPAPRTERRALPECVAAAAIAQQVGPELHQARAQMRQQLTRRLLALPELRHCQHHPDDPSWIAAIEHFAQQHADRLPQAVVHVTWARERLLVRARDIWLAGIERSLPDTTPAAGAWLRAVGEQLRRTPPTSALLEGPSPQGKLFGLAWPYVVEASYGDLPVRVLPPEQWATLCSPISLQPIWQQEQPTAICSGQVLHIYDFAELVADCAAHGTLLRNPMTRQLVPLGELVRLECAAEPGAAARHRRRGPARAGR